MSTSSDDCLEPDALVAAVRESGRQHCTGVDVPTPVLARLLATWQEQAEAARGDCPDLAEVYLACGCAADVTSAIAWFERAYFGSAIQALVRFSLTRDQIDDVLQQTRMRLFVPRSPGDPAPILRYAGMGRLGGLVRVTMIREAYRMSRSGGPDPARIHAWRSWATAIPEKELAQRQDRRLFAEALVEALRTLDEEEHRLLRQHFVAGLTAAEIARLASVHRATVGRRLRAVRKRLMDALRRSLTERAPLLAQERVDGGSMSLTDWMTSQLDLSLSGILAHA